MALLSAGLIELAPTIGARVGHLLARLGQADAARPAYARAVGLSEDPTVRAFLAGRAAAVSG